MDLAARLHERREEIERAALARVYGISDPATVGDPRYVEGLRSAVRSALGYGIEAISAPRERLVPIPLDLLAQARAAARNEIGLDIVLRRYVAGYALLGDFIAEELSREGVSTATFKRILRRQATMLDRLLTRVTEEYMCESEACPESQAQRRLQLVEMLLAGELVDTAELGYELDAWHLGAIAAGSDAEAAMRGFASALDRRLLMVCPEPGTVWAWLGGRREMAARETLELAGSDWPAEVCLTLGRPGRGVEGWRRTHRQAKAASAVALRGSSGPVCHDEVALLASALGDELLAASLREVYLLPLEGERDGGMVLRETLRAYFEARRNVSSAAAALGVTRQTVSFRLRLVEERLGQPVESCAMELEIALGLEGLSAFSVPQSVNSTTHID